jgi:hypothetical protein
LFTVTVTSPAIAGIPGSVVLMVTGPPTGAVPAAPPTVVTMPVKVGIASIGTDPGNSPLIVAVTVNRLFTGAPSVTVPETEEFWGSKLAVAVPAQPWAPTDAGRARPSDNRISSANGSRLCWSLRQ